MDNNARPYRTHIVKNLFAKVGIDRIASQLTGRSINYQTYFNIDSIALIITRL